MLVSEYLRSVVFVVSDYFTHLFGRGNEWSEFMGVHDGDTLRDVWSGDEKQEEESPFLYGVFGGEESAEDKRGLVGSKWEGWE